MSVALLLERKKRIQRRRRRRQREEETLIGLFVFLGTVWCLLPLPKVLLAFVDHVICAHLQREVNLVARPHHAHNGTVCYLLSQLN